MIRQWSDHETVSPQPASQPRLLFTLTASILNGKIKHFALRLSFQISPKTAPATKNDTATSPNTAPAAQNDSHDQTSAHMKRYLQCAKQHMPLSNLTKYCACHKKWFSWSNLFTHETLFTMRRATDATLQPHQILRLPRKITIQKSKRPLAKTDETSVPMRDRSENDPTMIRPWNRQSATRLATKVTFNSRWAPAFSMEKYNISCSGYLSKFHPILHLPRKMTLQHHQILHLPRKVTLVIDPCHTWNVISNARSNRYHCPTSPNTVPATQNECHD